MLQPRHSSLLSTYTHHSSQLSAGSSFIDADEASRRTNIQLPPDTKDEWMQRQSISVWPAPCDAENDHVDTAQFVTIMDSVENIEQDLRSWAAFDNNFLDTVNQKLKDLETNVSYLSNFFLADSQQSPSTGGHGDPREEFLKQLFDKKTLSAVATRKKVYKYQEVGEKRVAENAIFPGISTDTLTIPLPNQLEALYILDVVTRSQKIPKSLVKAWKKNYYSEASIAIFQNSFWWMWAHHFKPDEQLQDKLFNQISDAFLTLITTITSRHKDEYFKWYPSCLAQAVYSAFCHCFPESRKSFTDDFKQYIASTLLEWIMGVRSSLCSWTSWPLEDLDPYLHAGIEQEERPSLPKNLSSTEKGAKVKEKSACTVRFKSAGKRNGTAVRHKTRPSTQPAQQSHAIGPGATFERVHFNLSGCSPLVQHYMASHNLPNTHQFGPVLTRTEIKALPPPAPTYKELLSHLETEAEHKHKEYERRMLESDQEITMAQQRHHRLQNRMEKMNKEILQKKYEVKLLSEKLISRKQDLIPRRIKEAINQETKK